MIVALVFLFPFLAVATVDGFYFHLYKFRLHARPASQREHLLHTVNAVLLLPQIYLMFCTRPQGAWLLLAALLAAAVYLVELVDVLIENDSRADLGGLPAVEYAMHFSMATMRAAFVMAFFGTVSIADFTAAAALGEVPWWLRWAGYTVLAPATIAAVVHVALVVTGRRAPLPAVATAVH